MPAPPKANNHLRLEKVQREKLGELWGWDAGEGEAQIYLFIVVNYGFNFFRWQLQHLPLNWWTEKHIVCTDLTFSQWLSVTFLMNSFWCVIPFSQTDSCVHKTHSECSRKRLNPLLPRAAALDKVSSALFIHFVSFAAFEIKCTIYVICLSYYS